MKEKEKGPKWPKAKETEPVCKKEEVKAPEPKKDYHKPVKL